MVINDCFTIDVYSIVYLLSTCTETYDTQLKLDLDCILEGFNGQIGENCYGPWMNNAETMMMNYGSVRGGCLDDAFVVIPQLCGPWNRCGPEQEKHDWLCVCCMASNE